MKKRARTTYFFYEDGKINTVQEGQLHRAIFRAVNVPLAEQKTADAKDTSLLAIDGKNSIFTAQNAHGDEAHRFTAYGHNPTLSSAKTLLGYNGEQHALADLYLLGRGTRCYSASMGRFLSPDAFSPFGRGGINAYAYCSGDPINYFDDSGNMMRRSLFSGGARQRSEQRKKFLADVQDYANREADTSKEIITLTKKQENLIATRKALQKEHAGQIKFFANSNKSSYMLEPEVLRRTVSKNIVTNEKLSKNKADLESVSSGIKALKDRTRFERNTLEKTATPAETRVIKRMFNAADKTGSARSE